MSKPGLPVTIATATSAEGDDASVLTGTTGAVEALDPQWLTPNSNMAEFFKFEARAGRSTSHVWNFFHIVKGLKEGVDLNHEGLPTSFVKSNQTNTFACCNHCGTLIAVAVIVKGKETCWSTGSLGKHIKSGRHPGLSVEKLLFLRGKVHYWSNGSDETTSVASSNKRSKTQQSIVSFAKKDVIPPHLKNEHQQLCVVKFLVEQLLPFGSVESKCFRKMIASFNKQAKPMFNKRIKQLLKLLEGHIRKILAAEMRIYKTEENSHAMGIFDILLIKVKAKSISRKIPTPWEFSSKHD